MKPTVTLTTIGMAVLLAGCAGPRSSEPAVTPHPVAAASASTDAWPTLPLGVLATGTFTGAAHGEVQILNAGDGMFTVHIEGFGIDLDHFSGITAVPYSTYPAESCGSRHLAWSFGYKNMADVEETYEYAMPLYGFEGDPSLIRELIIQDLDAPNGSDQCVVEPAAKAVLDWTYRPLRAALTAVDSGVTGGAQGHANIVDGRIVSYVVARNDLFEEVAARFGLTVDDIRYLNPLHAPRLRVDETIVLDGASR